MRLTLEQELRKLGDDFTRRVGRDGVVPHAALCLSCGVALQGCSHDWDPREAGLPGDLVADIRDIAAASGKDLLETTRLLLASAVYLVAGRGGRSASIDMLQLRHGIEKAGFLDEPAQIVAFPVPVRALDPPQARREAPLRPRVKERADGEHDWARDDGTPLPG